MTWSRCALVVAYLLPLALPRIAVGQATARLIDDSLRVRVDRVFAAEDHANTPGCALGVARNGALVYERGYGMANLEYDVPITPATVFETGSVAKQFTATAILLLAREGKLSLDNDIRKYVPELPDYKLRYERPVTVREMLYHTSGLRDVYDLWAIAGNKLGTHVFSNADALAMARRQNALNHAPGDEYLYSNTNYILLATVVERVSGVSLQAFTSSHIFEPLGMTHTRWRDDFARVEKARATAYSPTSDGGFRADMPFLDTYGAGGLLTTVGDLLRWSQNFVEPRVGGGKLLDALLTRGRLSTGRLVGVAMGLVPDSLNGVSEVWASGATSGYRAVLAWYPDRRLSIALMCNAGGGIPLTRLREVASDFLPETHVPAAPPSEQPISLTSQEIAARAGMYLDRHSRSVMRITTQEGQLHFGVGGPLIIALSPTRLRVGALNLDLAYQPSSGRRAALMLLYQPTAGDTLRWERTPPVPPPSPAALARFAGTYANPEVETTYTVSADDGQLLLRQHEMPVANLQPAYTDAFTTPTGLIEFTRNSDGRVIGFHMSTTNARNLLFLRRPN
jgi:CubicO group peptidase (beta-lactamase class C family)